MIRDFSVIDLFCGVGGLTHGFVKEGFDVIAGIDFDQSCEYAYEANNNSTFYHIDISQLSSENLNDLYSEDKRKILIGCAPCQPYSIFNRNNNLQPDSNLDSRWQLLYSFANLIRHVRPEIVSMENVPLLKTFKNGEVFANFVRTLERAGYYVHHEIHDAQNYGVPQRRKRLVLLASLHGPITMIEPTHTGEQIVTVRDAIEDLPAIEDGEMYKKDKLHRARKLNDLTKQRIISTPEGGSWQDWGEALKLECHRKESGQLYKSVYGRMKWDEVAPTMTTYCTGINNGRFGHPEQHRAISLREAAIIQSFPKKYKFIDPNAQMKMGQLAKHIGNAVPVLLGKAIAKSIRKHIESL